LTALHCPADDPARIKIDDCKVSEAFAGADVGNVRDPGFVRSFDVKLTVERIVDNDGRPAAIFAGTTLVADLRLDPGKPGQTRDAVRAARFVLVEQIIVQLLFREMPLPMKASLPQFLGKKASTILGAIHSLSVYVAQAKLL